jgi:hypothetical protein
MRKSNTPCGAEHCQIGPSLGAVQGSHKRAPCIAKSVKAQRANGSTGLVSFFESHTEVSLEAPTACRRPRPAGVAAWAGGEIRGSA